MASGKSAYVRYTSDSSADEVPNRLQHEPLQSLCSCKEKVILSHVQVRDAKQASNVQTQDVRKTVYKCNELRK